MPESTPPTSPLPSLHTLTEVNQNLWQIVNDYGDFLGTFERVNMKWLYFTAELTPDEQIWLDLDDLLIFAEILVELTYGTLNS